MTAAEDRQALFTEASLGLGERWAESWREDLRREGRPVEGGWPGTLPEARARVSAYFGRELVQRGWSLLTADELGSVAHTTYEQARRVWLAMSLSRRSSAHPR